jgi:hypothetical protein
MSMGHVLQSGYRRGDEFEIGLAAAKLSVSFRPSVLVSAGDGTLRRQPGRGSQQHVFTCRNVHRHRLLCDSGDHQLSPVCRRNSDLREVGGLITT